MINCHKKKIVITRLMSVKNKNNLRKTFFLVKKKKRVRLISQNCFTSILKLCCVSLFAVNLTNLNSKAQKIFS